MEPFGLLQTSPAPSPPLRSAALQAEEEVARREPCSEDILHPLRVFYSRRQRMRERRAARAADVVPFSTKPSTI